METTQSKKHDQGLSTVILPERSVTPAGIIAKLSNLVSEPYSTNITQNLFWLLCYDSRWRDWSLWEDCSGQTLIQSLFTSVKSHKAYEKIIFACRWVRLNWAHMSYPLRGRSQHQYQPESQASAMRLHSLLPLYSLLFFFRLFPLE